MVLAYQIAQFALLAVFAVAISDFRKKKNMEPFGRRGFLIALKCVYLVPLAIYGWTLLNLAAVAPYDAIAILLTACGAYLAAKGKLDLGEHHAWTGYRRQGTQVVKSGIYSWIRNPIYSGIFAFIIGACVAALPRNSLALSAVAIATVVYIVGFLALSARRETQHLSLAFGKEYDDYKTQVHAFLPMKRYRDAA
jgi:protein-S-isoprenylcysteine O-methyltransferase Ste14